MGFPAAASKVLRHVLRARMRHKQAAAFQASWPAHSPVVPRGAVVAHAAAVTLGAREVAVAHGGGVAGVHGEGRGLLGIESGVGRR